ncbi:hypothetical protein PV326_000632, partial [Microctonus aethiopoides]
MDIGESTVAAATFGGSSGMGFLGGGLDRILSGSDTNAPTIVSQTTTGLLGSTAENGKGFDIWETFSRKNVERQDMLYQSLKLTYNVWVLNELKIQPGNPDVTLSLKSRTVEVAGGVFQSYN